MIRKIVILLVFGGALILSLGGNAIPEGGLIVSLSPEETDLLNRVILEVDDDMEMFVRRAERYIELKNWRHAVNAIRRVMKKDDSGGFFFPVDNELFVGVREYCRKLLNSMPEEGRAELRAAIDPQVETILDRARRSGAIIPALQLVTTDFYISSFGDEALNELGDIYMEQGRLSLALDCYQRLERHPDKDIPRIEIAVKKALALIGLGRKKEVDEIIDTLRREKNVAEIEVGGKNLKAVEFLGHQLKTGIVRRGFDPLAKVEWPVFGGSDLRLGVMNSSVSPDDLKWRYTLSGLHNSDKSLRMDPEQQYPFFPAVADNTVFISTVHGLVAMNLATGKFEGEYVAAANLDGYNNRGLSTNVAHMVTCDNGNVYAVVDWSIRRNNPFFRGGQSFAYTNKLVCLDGRPMKFVWKIAANTGSPGENILNRAYFVSAPVVKNGDIFIEAIVQNGNPESHLVCLDKHTGHFKWSIKLCSNMWFEANGRPIWTGNIFSNNSCITVGEDKLFVSTNTGAIFGIDPENRSIVWARKYPPAVRHRPMKKAIGRRFTSFDEWGVSAPILYGGSLFVAPQGGDVLYSLEPATGKVIWKYRRAVGERYLLGISGDTLVVGGSVATGIDSVTGKILWRWKGPDETVTGRGALVQDAVYLPFKGALWRVSVTNGKTVDHLKWPGDSLDGGNLLMCSGMMVVSGKHRFYGVSGKDFKVPAAVAQPLQKKALIAIDPKLALEVRRVLMLINQLTDNEWSRREAAVEALIKTGGPAIPHMVKYLDTRDAEVKMRLERILAALNWLTPDALSKKTSNLVSDLADMNWQVVEAAKREILKYRAQVMPSLIDTMAKSDHYDINRNIIDMLPQFGDAGIGALIDAIERFHKADDGVMRGYVRDALEKATGQQFKSYQVGKWREWWEKNKARILKEEAEKERLEKKASEKAKLKNPNLNPQDK